VQQPRRHLNGDALLGHRAVYKKHVQKSNNEHVELTRELECSLARKLSAFSTKKFLKKAKAMAALYYHRSGSWSARANDAAALNAAVHCTC